MPMTQFPLSGLETETATVTPKTSTSVGLITLWGLRSADRKNADLA